MVLRERGAASLAEEVLNLRRTSVVMIAEMRNMPARIVAELRAADEQNVVAAAAARQGRNRGGAGWAQTSAEGLRSVYSSRSQVLRRHDALAAKHAFLGGSGCE